MATQKIYTQRGDDGWTDLASGERVEKDALSIEVDGTLDELNAHLGLLLTLLPEDERAFFEDVQRHLFGMGAWVAGGRGGKHLPTAADVAALEAWIDASLDVVGSLFTGFVLPGGCPAAAQAQVARTICRRAERRLVTYLRSIGFFNPPTTETSSPTTTFSPPTHSRPLPTAEKSSGNSLSEARQSEARELLRYLNRLSDVLYACAKKINFLSGVKENHL